jgi:hypothetical protein
VKIVIFSSPYVFFCFSVLERMVKVKKKDKVVPVLN